MSSDESTQVPTTRGRLLVLAPDPTISGPVPGPIGKLAHRLADGLRSAGFSVDTELWGRHERDEGPARKVAGRAADLMRIRRRIRRDSYDLVFVNTTHDSRALLRELLLVLPSPRRVRWVFLVHGSRFAPGRRAFKFATRLLVRRASAVLLLSSEEVEEWRAFYPPGQFRLVANALAPRAAGRTAASPAVPPELLFVGRLIREKGVYDVLEAFAAVRSRRECRLTMAGEGPELERLRARAADLGVAADVEFAGHLSEDDLDRMYGRAGVFVLPTYFGEGLPTVLLEAMSAGLPIVTTHIRGAADRLAEGENALFVPPRDPGALAAAIDRLLDDDVLWTAMRENNLRKAENFAPDRVAEAYARIFDEVIGRRAER
jgi:glycosyltransferase involved in cell wall biosynthesis